MKRLTTALVWVLVFELGLSAGPDEEFAAVVAAVQRGDQLVQQGKDRLALDEYRKAQESLLKFKTVYPRWDPEVVTFRLRYLGERLGNGPGPVEAKPSADAAELQALQQRVQFLERSGQQYQAQVNQLLAENNRLSVRLREALAIRPAAQEPAAVAETQSKLETALKEVGRFQSRVRELEAELAGIPKPEEARQNARQLEETRKSLRQAVSEAEALRKELAGRREAVAPAAVNPPDLAELAAQLQAIRVTQSATEMELLKVRTENEDLRARLATATSRPAAAPSPAGAALRPLDRARLARAEGQLAEARQLLEAALAAKPDDAEAWYLLGKVRLEAGEFPEAAQALQRSLAIAPELGVTQLELARLYQKQPAPDLGLSRWHYHRAVGSGAPRDLVFEKEIGWEQPAPVK